MNMKYKESEGITKKAHLRVVGDGIFDDVTPSFGRMEAALVVKVAVANEV